MAAYIKSNIKRKKFFNPRNLLIIGILLAGLTWYLYQSYSTGTGLFAAFSSVASINRVVVEDENSAKNAAELKAIRNLNNAANAEAQAKTAAQKKKAEAALNTASTQYSAAQAATIAQAKAEADKKAACSLCLKNSSSAAACTSVCGAPIIPPITSGGTSTPEKRICNTGTAGVNVESGKWVATGFGLDKDGNRCTTGGCSQRECVQITDKCGHSKPKPCDVQYQTDPSSVVLPSGGGTEYTVGKTAAEIAQAEKEAKEKGEAPPTKTLPKNQCYDKNEAGQWVIITDGTPKSDDANKVCGDGKFVTKTEYTAAQKASCEADGLHTWNGAGCDPKKLGSSDADKKAQAADCRAQNKSYDAVKNTCGSTLKCGPGYKLRESDGFCDLDNPRGSEAIRDGIIRSGESFCKSVGKKFEPSTGLCIGVGETPSAGRPRTCATGITYTSGTKNGYRFCEVDKNGLVINEKYIFCDSSTSNYDSKTGECSLKPEVAVAVNPPKIVNYDGQVGGTANSPSGCKYSGARPQFGGPSGGLWNCPDEPKPTSVVSPKEEVVFPPRKIINPNGKVGGGASDPDDCKYEGAYILIGGLWSCPDEPTPVVQTANPEVPVVMSENAYQSLKIGDQCGSLGYPSCDKCEGGISTKYTESGAPVTFNKCGDEAQVKTILDADKVPPSDQKIIGDNSSDQILATGSVCKDGVFSTAKCSQCSSGSSTVIEVNGESTKVCGSKNDLAKVDLVNISGDLTPPNTVGGNATIGAGAGCLAGAVTYGAIGFAWGVVVGGIGEVVTTPLGIIGGCVVGAIGGAGVGAAVTPTNTTPASVVKLKSAGESCGHNIAGFIRVKDKNGDASCSNGVCEFMEGIAENGVDVRSSGYYCK